MKMKIYYILMLIGAILMFSQLGNPAPYATYLTIIGVIMMFIGISRISRNLPSREKSDYPFNIIDKSDTEKDGKDTKNQ